MSLPLSAHGREFPLLNDIIAFTDIAMRSRTRFARLELLCQGITSILRTRIALPPYLLVSDPWRYVRQELYRSQELGYQIVAITWAPGQTSGIHDHGEMWGIEAILAGSLEVTDYAIDQQTDALVKMHRLGSRMLEAGDVISLLPPHDLHSCQNLRQATTVSLHIYGKPLEVIRRFVASGQAYREDKARLHVV
ncbi:MAG: cysteine dioxygenase family protein [Pseudoxanthomonas sp.]